MKQNKAFKNSAFSIAQTIVLAIVSIVLFKMSVNIVGLEKTGVWSYLTSINSIAGFGSFGFSNAIIYFLPKYTVTSNNKIAQLINTSFVSVFFVSIVLCCISYAVFYIIIPHTVAAQLIKEAYFLLPFIVVAYFFSGLSSVYISALDGLLLFQLRAKINIVSYFIFFIIGFLLLKKMGVAGIAIAQIIQNIFLLVVTYWHVKKNIAHYHFSFTFNSIIFKEVFKFGFNFQLISITQIISEPFMKSMITKFGGAAYTAIFDFIIKLLSISRNLIIAANQTIVPQLTIYKGLKKITTLKTLYKANFKIVLFLSILLFLTPLVFSDALSIFFLNEKSNLFCFILLNVSLGLLINAFALPAHFHFLGIGQIRWNVLNNILTAALMLVSAPLLGYFFQAKYIVLSWSISTMAGPILLMYVMHKQYKLSLNIFYSWHNLLLIISIIIAIVVNKFVSNSILPTNQVYINVAVSLIVYLAIVILPIKSHPIVIKFLQKHFNQNK